MFSEPAASRHQALLSADNPSAEANVANGAAAAAASGWLLLPPQDSDQSSDREQCTDREQPIDRDPSVGREQPPPEEPPPSGRWGTVFALFALCAACQANVFMLPYLFSVPSSRGPSASLRLDVGLTETGFGLLQSYVGIVPRLVCIVGTGKLSSFATPAQKRGLAVASGVFMLAGLGVYVVATSVAALGAAVVLVNVGVGVNTPMNAILVGDMFDRSSRAMPMACIVCADYLGSGLAGLAAAAAVGLDSWRLAVTGYAVATLGATVLAVVLIAYAPPIAPPRPSDLSALAVGRGGKYARGARQQLYQEAAVDAREGRQPHARSPLFSHRASGRSGGGGVGAPLLPPPPVSAAPAAAAPVSAARAVAGVAAISVDRHFVSGAGPPIFSAAPHASANGGKQNGGGKSSSTRGQGSNRSGGKGSKIAGNATGGGTPPVEGAGAESTILPAMGGDATGGWQRSSLMASERSSSISESSRSGSERNNRSRTSRTSVSIFDGSVGYENGYENGENGDDENDDDDNTEDRDDDDESEAGGESGHGGEGGGSSQLGPLAVICASPKLLLIFLGGGVRYGAGMSIASYNPQYFAAAFPGHAHLVAFSLHASVSVIACGTVAQLGSGYATQQWWPGLTLPVATSLCGGLAAGAMYLQPSFNGAAALLYATYFLGEGWFVGVLTTLQHALPPGAPRDAGLGLFFASSVLIGAADVFATSQSGIGDALAAAEVDGEGGGTTAANDDNGGNDGSSSSSGVDDGPATATVGGVWAWLVDGSGGARRTMLLGVAAMYLLSGVVFALAAAAPQAWPGCGSAGQRPRRRRRAAAGT